MLMRVGWHRIKLIVLAAPIAVATLTGGCSNSALTNSSLGTFSATGSASQQPDQSGLGSGSSLASTGIEEKKSLTASKASRRIAEQVTASSQPGNQGYKIGPQDMLDFAVFKAPELQRSVQVSEIGTINLPLLGDIQASGRTASELEKEIAGRLGKKFLQNPQVSINIREYNSQRITLEGAVKKPGVYPLRGRTTLLQVVALAEGFSDVGDATVVIFRQEGNQRLAAKFSIADIRSGSAADPQLQPGDTIVAPTSMTKEAFASIMKAMPLATFAALAL